MPLTAKGDNMSVKNILTRSSALLVCLCMLAALAACGAGAGSQEASKTQPAQTEQGQVADETQPGEADPT